MSVKPNRLPGDVANARLEIICHELASAHGRRDPHSAGMIQEAAAAIWGVVNSHTLRRFAAELARTVDGLETRGVRVDVDGQWAVSYSHAGIAGRACSEPMTHDQASALYRSLMTLSGAYPMLCRVVRATDMLKDVERDAPPAEMRAGNV